MSNVSRADKSSSTNWIILHGRPRLQIIWSSGVASSAARLREESPRDVSSGSDVTADNQARLISRVDLDETGAGDVDDVDGSEAVETSANDVVREDSAEKVKSSSLDRSAQDSVVEEFIFKTR